ncbi:MAG: methyl-accepting chemotaxis protein [Myxococcota bacterium]|nr:methyl-accepting chemotaxis protein [Myxococcota bacterium]
MKAEDHKLPIDILRDRQRKSFHFVVQRILLYVMAPIVFLAYGATMVRKDFAWQAVVQFTLGLCAIVSWVIGHFFTRKNRIDAAAYTSLVGLQLFVGFSMLTTYGNAATLLFTAQLTIIYASMFTGRQMLIAFAGTATFYLLGETAWYFQWWTKIELTPKEAFFRSLPFFIMALISEVVLLKHSQKMNELLLSDVHRFAGEQRDVVVSASQLGHTLDTAVGEIEGISTELGHKASAQSTAIDQMDKTISELRQFSRESFGAASDTQKAVFKLQDAAKRGNSRLREVESRFGTIVGSYGVMRSQFDELSAQAVRIESILQTNREIAGQIKILATNAAVQAAKAGAYGAGFGVVALELKGMIQRIEASLVEGRKLLFDIRTRAKESSVAIEQNTGLLENHASDLEETTRLIDSLEQEFLAAAQKMTSITSAAESQGHRLDSVASGMSQVELSALALAQSTMKLQSTVDQIAQSQGAMSQLLGSSETSS